MPHLFLNCDNFNGDERFATTSAILTRTPYPPKVLIVGTYNDGNHLNNPADFFYGRNYFWPIFENFANNYAGNARLTSRRVSPIPGPAINPPTITRILELCGLFKLTFADLIQDVGVPLGNHGDSNLEAAVANNQVVINVPSIIDYINETPTLEHVYLTTALNQFPHLNGLWNDLVNGARAGVGYGKILTPSGRGNIPAIAGRDLIYKISHYWMWVNDMHAVENPINNPAYVHLNRQWLIECGVNPNLF